MTWSGDQTVLGGATAPMLSTTAMNSPARYDRVPASRQKSCNACVRGKRRCDKRAPNCTRCAARGLDCVYQRLPHSSMTDASSVSASASAAAAAAADLADFGLNFDMDMEGLTSDSSPGSSSLHTDLGLQLDPVLDFSIADLVADGCGNDNGAGTCLPSTDNALSPCRELWNMQQSFGGGPGKMDLPPLPTVPRLPLRDLRTLQGASECVTLDLALNQLYDPGTRIGWVLERATAMPAEFARTRALSYIHPRLWAGATPAPKTVMAAFTAAAAHSACTPQNKGWTCKLVMDAAREVHREGETAETPAQRLGRVQAAVIVASIKMFDGDITMRSSAEREMVVLHGWIKDLLLLVRETCALQDVEDELTPKSWDSWVFAESMRRTVVWATMFTCFISLLQSSQRTSHRAAVFLLAQC
jgi:hypothetical protein